MAAPMMNASRNLVFFSVKQAVSGCRYQQRRLLQSSIRDIKKFYKNATITSNNGWYEINLDNRKLRTPTGNIFRVPNESLALAVVTEWNAQDKLIKGHTMHLNSLCNTALDNPMHRTKTEMTDSIIHFLDTDTICYRMNSPPDLKHFLESGWDPILEFARETHGIIVHPTTDIMAPDVPQETKETVKRYLLSYSDWALHGFQYAVDSVKSLLIVIALLDRFISVEKAVDLARLEQAYQTQRWGSVEWYHDIDVYELRTRLAAATLFIRWCSENVTIKKKASMSSS